MADLPKTRWVGPSAALASVLVLVVSLYVGVTRAYFCSYDDFYDVHRAIFLDSREPIRMFTTALDSLRYRPLNRALTVVSTLAGDGRPLPFRVRNLGFHLLNIGAVAALGRLLTRSNWISVVGAAMFGVSPLANMSIVGATVTNAGAHGLALLAILMVGWSGGAGSRPAWLAGGVMVGWLGLLTYDPEISVFPLLAAYVMLEPWIRRRGLDAWRLAGVVVGGGIAVVSYLALRLAFVPGGFANASAGWPGPVVVLRNLVTYIVALALPVDPVLTHRLWGTPFPSDLLLMNESSERLAPLMRVMRASPATVLAIGLSASVVVFGLGWLFARAVAEARRQGGQEDPRAITTFLLLGVVVPLMPVLAVAAHPSETYLYTSVAAFSLLVSYLVARGLGTGCRAQYVRICIVVAVILLGISGTLVRNDEVSKCAQAAKRVLTSVGQAYIDGNVRTVVLANVPRQESARRYGSYGIRGLDAIGDRDHASPALTAALQLYFRNESIRGEAVSAAELAQACAEGRDSRRLYFWVHPDGRVEACLSPPGRASLR